MLLLLNFSVSHVFCWRWGWSPLSSSSPSTFPQVHTFRPILSQCNYVLVLVRSVTTAYTMAVCGLFTAEPYGTSLVQVSRMLSLRQRFVPGVYPRVIPEQCLAGGGGARCRVGQLWAGLACRVAQNWDPLNLCATTWTSRWALPGEEAWPCMNQLP